MGLKKLLWNDKATELFGHCRDQDEHVAPEHPEEDTTSHRSHTARKVLKGSTAFTSALLFGTNESQGLLRTLGEASIESSKKALSTYSKVSDEEARRENDFKYRHGPEGDGYYMNGYKVSD